MEVVRLVGEGLRNDAIARRLFIAPGTVKVHLSHIFAKLGIATRAELAAQAAWGAPSLPDCGPPVGSIRKGLGVNGRQEKEFHA